MRPLLIRHAELPGLGRRDVRVERERVTAISERLEIAPGERCIDAAGGALVPGLNDHHLHLFATAAARLSVDCSPATVPDAQALALALGTARGRGWIRGYGFHDSVCPGLDRRWLDQVVPDRPVRIQHRSGMLWILNSVALDALDMGNESSLPDGVARLDDGSPNGYFYNLDTWLRRRLKPERPSLAPLSAELARYGITGVTDTGASNDVQTFDAMAVAQRSGEFSQRILLMGNESLGESRGTGVRALSVGALKIYLREVDLPPLGQLVARIRCAHDAGRNIAAHCVTRTELVYLLAALGEAGTMAGDRVEHGAVAEDASIDALAGLGVSVVTQPHFIVERGDRYRIDVEDEDIPLLYRGKAFLDAGVALAAGSDSPYGSLDPWAAMRAATTRRTRDGVIMGHAERLDEAAAFALFGGTLELPGSGYRAVRVGDRADLCLLGRPWQQVLGALDCAGVRLTLCGGEVAYDAAA